MKNNLKTFFASLALIYGLNAAASAQFPKIPKVDKTNIPKVEQPSTGTTTTGTTQTTSSGGVETRPSSTGSSSSQPVMPQTAVLKPTLRIVTLRDQRYWKQPDQNNYWSWIPKIMFDVTGPIPDSSYLTVDYTTPDGKLWYSDKSDSFSVREGSTYTAEMGRLSSNPGDKRTTIATGVYGFKITLKNELQGINKEIYNGKFKVNKFFAGTSNANFKYQYVFYVDQDWALPIGYLWLDGKQNPTASILTSAMWFRGEQDEFKLAAYLYYNGKQISSTKDNSTGKADSKYLIVSEGDSDDKVRWEQFNFIFYNVRSFDSAGNAGNVHLLKRNPGNYEIKVLLDGELVRTTSFTVGGNGEIADNGTATQNGIGGYRMVLPVKVNPVKEGTIDVNAWKTDAFYSNPLTGFNVP